jgi:hypothetical protein
LEERIRRNKRASEERDETVDQHIDDSDGSHSSDDTADFPFQPRHSALKYVAHRPHDQNINVPTIGVTRPDGPSSGVDPEADIRREFSQALGQDVDEMLDEEMGDAEEMEDDVSEWDEYVENTCNGIQDIIITGEVSHSYHNYIETRLIFLHRLFTVMAKLGSTIASTAVFVDGMDSSPLFASLRSSQSSGPLSSVVTLLPIRTLLATGVRSRSMLMPYLLKGLSSPAVRSLRSSDPS